MSVTVNGDSAKAVGILAASFLTSMIVASFFYIQPGGAQAYIDETINCSSHGVVEDSPKGNNNVIVTVETTAGCPANPLIVTELSEEGYENVILTILPDIEKDGTRVAKAEFNVSKYVKSYLVTIDGAFSASLTP